MRIKRILCIVDSYEWALANRARALKRHFKECEVDIKYFRDLGKTNFNNYNVVYSLNWPIHGYIHKKISSKRKYRLITSVSSHIGQPRDHVFKNLLSHYDGVSLSNKFLHREFYKKFPDLNIYYTPFGVNHRTFYPKNKASDYSRIFGWVGNLHRDVKRFDIIEEVFNSLQLEDITLEVVTQESGYSRNEMADFYNTIGTLVCFSESEGTPNPVLEAAACGRSIISSNVGNVPQLIRGSRIKPVRTKHELRRAILENANNPKKIEEDSKFLKMKIDQYWKWDIRAEDFREFLGV